MPASDAFSCVLFFFALLFLVSCFAILSPNLLCAFFFCFHCLPTPNCLLFLTSFLIVIVVNVAVVVVIVVAVVVVVYAVSPKMISADLDGAENRINLLEMLLNVRY